MTTSGHIIHHTASEAAGTGADITLHGTGIHGLIVLGDITDFMTRGTTAAGMEDGMTHGITADGTGVSTIHGTTAAGTVLGVTIMQDGTADGMILIGDTISDRDISRDMDMEVRVTNRTRIINHESITEQDTAQVLTECLPEQVLFVEEAA